MIKRFSCIKICDKNMGNVNDLSSGQYSVNENIRFKTLMLRSNLCDCSSAYICCKRESRC